MSVNEANVLVVFSSLFGANAELAALVEPVLNDLGSEARLCGVKQLVLEEHMAASAKSAGEATKDDLAWADGLIFTSPAHTGLLSASIKAFIDENHDDASKGAYLSKTFTAMATSDLAHAGQERVVDDLNAVGAAWGCVLVPPSTANATINKLDGKPYGLSFVLKKGAIADVDTTREVLHAHLERFVAITDALAALKQGQGGPAPKRQPARATDVLS